MSDSIIAQAVDDTLVGVRASIERHMPASPYRTYWAWLFSDANPRLDDWIKLSGLYQLVVLTVKLYRETVGDDGLPSFVTGCIPVNIYQLYEIVSDNMALGLATHSFDVPEVRAELLLRFNDAAQTSLREDTYLAEAMLSPYREQASQVSLFMSSLSPHKHVSFLDLYMAHHPDADRDAIEFGGWNALVANIRSCVDTARHISPHPLGDLVREGFIRRYGAVSTLLDSDGPLGIDRSLQVGTDTILVAPILGYMIAATDFAAADQSGIPNTIRSV